MFRQRTTGLACMEKQFSYDLGSALGSETSFGLIVLQSDETIEHDMRRLLPSEGAALYTSRVPSGADVRRADTCCIAFSSACVF